MNELLEKVAITRGNFAELIAKANLAKANLTRLRDEDDVDEEVYGRIMKSIFQMNSDLAKYSIETQQLIREIDGIIELSGMDSQLN